ncbi:MAG: tetratricopeptide repeat protein [Anaerolineae bacterium]|nr:tetratricopeptide repeat protein [Anaerolineae bacterium]
MDFFRRIFSKTDEGFTQTEQPKTEQKTVFISYRREVSSYIARAVFMDLRTHGFDVFMDVESINAGEFGRAIQHQIAARAHFVVILGPGSVERCADEGDWLRHEIETALDHRRNIIPLLCDNFTFAGSEQHLTGRLAQLSSFNGLNIHHDYFDEAMTKLRTRFLVQPPDVPLAPLSTQEQRVIRETIAAVASQPAPTRDELQAEALFRQGYAWQKDNDFDKAISFYDQAIALNPQYTKAYYNRGLAHYYRKELPQAIENYDKAIALKPDYAKAYNNRGLARFEQGQLTESLADYDEAIRLNSTYAIAYNNRGNSRAASGDFASAVADYEWYLLLGGGREYGNQASIEKIIQELKVAVESGSDQGLSDTTRRQFVKLTTGMLPAVPHEDGIVDGETLFQPNVITQELMMIPDGVTRGLPVEPAIALEQKLLTYGQATDVGMVRSNNQDAIASLVASNRSDNPRPDFGLFIVADGMGGHLDGEKASALVAQMLETEVVSQIYLPLNRAATDDSDTPPISESLVTAVQKVDTALKQAVPDGGCTLTAAILVGNLMFVAHVGDTRLYLINDSGIEQLTRDHTLVQRLVELGQITPEEAKDHPKRNVVYRALGQNDELEVDTLMRRLPPRAQILVCSDGLWGNVSDVELREIVRNPSLSPQEACNKLVALANERGGSDNISVIVVQMPGV